MGPKFDVGLTFSFVPKFVVGLKFNLIMNMHARTSLFLMLDPVF